MTSSDSTPTRPDMVASAALSLAGSIITLLIHKNIIAREDAIGMLTELVMRKASVAHQSRSEAEAGGAALLSQLAKDLEAYSEIKSEEEP